MRILRIIHSVNPEHGGPIEGIKQSARVLAGLGHAVEIASLDSPGDIWVKDCPVRVHALGLGKGGYGYSPNYAPWLRQKAAAFDVVVVSGLWRYHSFGAWRALRNLNTPYFVFPHGMLDPWFKRTYPLKHLKKWLYWPWAEYRVLRDAKAVLFTCEEERRLARRSFWLYRCKERVVNYGTAAPEGYPESQKRVFFERFPDLRGGRFLLFLSRIHPKKGCDLLIKAFARLFKSEIGNRKSEIGAPHLVIAGPDQVGWATELKALASQLGIASRITWPGMLTGDLKWGLLRAADALILPSHQENFGIAVVEALACGTPVLISDKVNIWREVAADGAGFVASDTEAGISQLLAQWLDLPGSEKKQARVRAVNCFRRRFEITQAAHSLLSVFSAPA